jgi:hypothetical protein
MFLGIIVSIVFGMYQLFRRLKQQFSFFKITTGLIDAGGFQKAIEKVSSGNRFQFGMYVYERVS